MLKIIGEPFGRHVFTECRCGTITVSRYDHVRNGSTKTCGCSRSVRSLSKMREYKAWSGMKKRCYSKTNVNYPNYGARGITVCDRWMESFLFFYADMGSCPDDYSLDRIDNNGPYSPENCRWADRKTQCNNTRRNVMIEHDGETKSVTQWAEHHGVNKHKLRNYIHRGLKLDAAITKLKGEK